MSGRSQGESRVIDPRYSRPRMLSAREAAERCGVKDPETVKAWARRAGFNMPRLGRGRYTLRFPEELIDELLARRTPQIARMPGGFRGTGAR